MESDGRPLLAASSSSASLSSSRGATPSAHPATPPDGYELRPLPPNPRSTAPAKRVPHDDLDLAASSTDPLQLPEEREMSRAPLLVRSSPAQGTGSYGGLPVLSMSSSPESEDHHVTSFLQRNKKKKGKSKLRHSEAAESRLSTIRSHGDSVRSEPVYTTSRSRRRSSRDPSNTTALDDALEGQEESHLEARFNAGGTVPIAVGGAPRAFESLQTSSSSSHVDEADDDSTSESDDLDEVKTNGHPQDDSPYAQVRAAVPPTDDISLSINTPRMWTLSILFAILGSSTNLFFSLRYPSVSITPIIALLLVHPLGLFWDSVLKRPGDPDETFVHGALQSEGGAPYASSGTSRIPRSKASKRQRFRLWLAQGRWNQKEHCCVYISSNVSFGFAFATDVGTVLDE